MAASDSESIISLASLGISAEVLPGKKISRERILEDLTGVDFSFSHFQDVEAKGRSFSKCNFQHCVFERCYFRAATFKNCDFTGSRFIDCNLRSAKVITCKIEYTAYRGTTLDRKEFAANLPHWENVRAEVARSLRMNAQGLGDAAGVNFFIDTEINGTLEHWWKAFCQQESYYQQKYRGFRRVVALGRFSYHWIARSVWGHGESPWRIFRNIFSVLCLVTFLIVIQKVANSPGFAAEKLVPLAVEAFFATVRTFLGVAQPVGQQIPQGFDLALVGLRYVALALFVGVLAKRWNFR
jgi:hypothetical protein